MNEYPKIHTIYKRDPANKHRTLLEGEFSLPEFKYLSGNEWSFTEKVDGTNIRIEFEIGQRPRFLGRTASAQIPATLFERLSEMFTLEVFEKNFDGPLTLYGEGYGPKIQKGGGNYGSEQNFVLFDVRCGEYWLRQEDAESVAHKLSISVVPEVGRGTLFDAIEMVRFGLTSQWGDDFMAEGIVARPTEQLFDRRGERIIAKIKHKDFAKQPVG